MRVIIVIRTGRDAFGSSLEFDCSGLRMRNLCANRMDVRAVVFMSLAISIASNGEVKDSVEWHIKHSASIMSRCAFNLHRVVESVSIDAENGLGSDDSPSVFEDTFHSISDDSLRLRVIIFRRSLSRRSTVNLPIKLLLVAAH